MSSIKVLIGAQDLPKVVYPEKLKYIECHKKGFHYGQYLNMVCMEPSCLQNLTCCCACIEQSHKHHLTKPLKVVIREAKDHSQKIGYKCEKQKFDIEKTIKLVKDSQEKALDVIRKARIDINTKLDQIQKGTVGYFGSVVEKVRIKASDPRISVQEALDIIHAQPATQQFKQAVKTLTSVIPQVKDKSQPLSQTNPEQKMGQTQQSLTNSILTGSLQLYGTLSKTLQSLTCMLSTFHETFQKDLNTRDIFQTPSSLFKFNPESKHVNVKITSQNIVKSVNISGYKFAVMSPGLEKGGIKEKKTFAFKVKESTSNWVAVGMCHRNIVKSKNFGFNFGGIGHGGYLVSANGGSWSNIKAEFNNSIKSFKFVKGDVIVVSADFQTNKISFKKKTDTFELDFKTIEGDQLYPCALFYYINDEIEFLPEYTEQ